MNEQENTRIVRQSYERFKNGDIQGLLDMYSEDINWHQTGTENVPFIRERKGREDVADFFQSLAQEQDALSFNPQEFIAQGDKVVVLGDYSWRVKATGKEYNSDWVHVITVRDGKIVGFKEYTDTAAASKAHQKAVNA